MPELILPIDGVHTRCRIERACTYLPPEKPLTSRIAYSAAHVVGDGSEIDWEATLAYRRHLVVLRIGSRRGDGHGPARDGIAVDVGA